jgi:DNA-binding NarL/FixJ family response regulator
MTLRLLVADHQDVVRRGVRDVLVSERGWQVCAEAASGPQAIARAIETRPDIAVIDLAIPEIHGLEVTRRICAALPDTEVLIFSAHEGEELVREAIVAGAGGYVLKSDGAQQLVAAVEALARHEFYLTPQVLRGVAEGVLRRRRMGWPGPAGALTPREREVVGLVAAAKSNRQIAATLGISVRTVETHRAAMMRKLEAASIVDVVRYAIRTGLAAA